LKSGEIANGSQKIRYLCGDYTDIIIAEEERLTYFDPSASCITGDGS